MSDSNKDVPSTKSLLDRLAHALPDIPRWLYVRSMLLSGRCEVLGLAEGGPEPQFVARELEESEDRAVCVVGRPPADAMLADGRPVSFCYAADETEGLWDISIDTLEPYRRQGYAARCVSYMVDEMRRRGKEPVWAAEETNLPSMRLAAKLGFVPVDGLLLFRPSVRA